MHWTERLSDYIDGELTPAEQAACEDHLASCDACRAGASELRAVVAWAKADRDRTPHADLWPNVLARITAPAGLDANRRGPRRVSLTLPQLALAASLLIAVSAGVAYLAANRGVAAPPAGAIQAHAEALPAAGGVERANFADATFDEAVDDLERVLRDRRGDLDPRTVLVIERNLAVVDQAIREARAALDADPANTFLNSYLTDARRRKLELLRRATTLASASGD